MLTWPLLAYLVLGRIPVNCNQAREPGQPAAARGGAASSSATTARVAGARSSSPPASPAAQVLDPVQVAQRRQQPHHEAGAGRMEYAIALAGRRELTPLATHTDLE
jgi:hypothetical protein